MIGIVLWSDPNDCKAVFWCEDHGDLAYYSAEFDEKKAVGGFAAGDMVEFDVFTDAEFRRAVNPRLVQENACDGLERRLQSTARKTAEPAQQRVSGQVLQFRQHPDPAEQEPLRSKQR